MTSKLSVEAAEVAGGAGRHTMVELGWGVLGVTCGVCLVYQVRAVAVALGPAGLEISMDSEK